MEKKNRTGFEKSDSYKSCRNRYVKEFRETLETMDMEERDKKSLEFIIDYFENKYSPKLSSRIFMFRGPPGVGKTFLAEKLLKALDVEVVYMAYNNFSFNHMVRCNILDEVIEKVNNNAKQQAIFLDDLTHILKKKRDDSMLADDEYKKLTQLIEIVKNDPRKIMLITVNNLNSLSWVIMDRIEVKIDFDLPGDASKEKFLEMEYGEYLNREQRKFVVINSIGYNYRELAEVIKLAYRLNNARITMHSIKKAFRLYQSVGLGEYEILKGIETDVNDLIGKKKARTVIERLVKIYRNRELGKKLGLKGANLLLFYGPPGTGKSFTARALAGELGFPLINVKGTDLMDSPLYEIDRIIELAKRYRNCVVFMDEVDKFIGNDIFAPDNPLLGELHSSVDGADDREIQSVLILAVNDLSRFSKTFLDRFTMIRFDLPSYDERADFFRKKVKEVKKYVKINVSYKELAKNTDNMSFRDIERFWNELMFHHLDNKTEINSRIVHNVVSQIGSDKKIELKGYI